MNKSFEFISVIEACRLANSGYNGQSYSCVIKGMREHESKKDWIEL